MNENLTILAPNPFTTVLFEYGKSYLFDFFRRFQELGIKTEYQMVVKGLRKANVYHMTPENFDIQIEQIMKDKLVFLPIHRTRKYAGFAHCHNFVENIDSNTMIYGVIAQDLETAQQFVDVQKDNVNHEITGELLGYPKCCADKFTEYFTKSYDPIWEPALETEGSYMSKDGVLHVPYYNPKLLQHLRYYGLRITPWFPCNFLCEESSIKAEIWFNLMKELDEGLANNLLEIMNLKGSTWDLYNAQIYSNIPKCGIGIAGSYYTSERRVIIFGDA